MTREQVVDNLRSVIRPYVEVAAQLENMTEDAELAGDLHINSMHLMDIIIDLEAAFDIEIADNDIDGLRKIGDVVNLVERRLNDASTAS